MVTCHASLDRMMTVSLRNRTLWFVRCVKGPVATVLYVLTCRKHPVTHTKCSPKSCHSIHKSNMVPYCPVECLSSRGIILVLAVVTGGSMRVGCKSLLELGVVGGKYAGSDRSELGVYRICSERSGATGHGTGGLQSPVGAS